MEGKETYRFATRTLASTALESVRKSGLQPADIDLFIPHQANTRIIESAVRRLGIPRDRVYINIDRFGNTSSASIPIALSEAQAEGRLQPGDTVVMVGFGAGLTWGAGAMQWAAHVAPHREPAQMQQVATTS
jgi:3-oxoacyl-[acyl-carrier-protein] synthase-3